MSSTAISTHLPGLPSTIRTPSPAHIPLHALSDGMDIEALASSPATLALAPTPGQPRRCWRPAISPTVLRGVGLAAAAGVAAGISTPLIALATNKSGPFLSAAFMEGGAAVFTGLAGRVVPQTGRALHANDILPVALVGVAGGVGYSGLLALALKYTSATSVALTTNMETVFVVLGAWLCLHEPFGKRMFFATAAMVGSAGVASAGQLTQGVASAEGIGIALACAASGAITALVSQKLCDCKPLDWVSLSCVAGATASSVIGLALKEPLARDAHIAAMIGCGVLVGGAAYTLYPLAQRSIGSARTSTVFSVAPFVGAAASWALGQGKVGPLTGVAAVLLVIGVYLNATEAQMRARQAAPARGPEHVYAQSARALSTDGVPTDASLILRRAPSAPF